jgi:hypothetical protein
MRDWVVPAPLSQPVPRKVRMTGATFAALLLIPAFFSVPFIIFYFAAFVPAQQEKMLETQGVDIFGRVVGLPDPGGAGRGYHGPRVEFIYAPKELAGTPDRIVHGWNAVSEEEYETLRVGVVVPLVYDPARPEHALLKSIVEARRLRKGPRWEPLVVFLTALMAIIMTPILILPWMFFRQKRLLQWGKAARATIIGRSESTYKGNSTSSVTYSFQDDRGASWTGQTTISLGRPDDPRPSPDLIEVPTAVYDPRNGARNMLYPGSAWTLVD